jgi:hypothetical protein
MVKRMQHIGTFLHNEMGVSLRGMSPMCRHFVNSSSENLFLKVYTCARHASRAFRKFVTSYFHLCSTAMVAVRQAYLCRMAN